MRRAIPCLEFRVRAGLERPDGVKAVSPGARPHVAAVRPHTRRRHGTARQAGVPATLSRWVREIVGAIPGPARSTVAELILGALLGGGGHVTRAILALTP